ncbi:hypothetical protein [Phytoactinopolyspora halophila]|uniref:Uncharacterized protein n=1 Tax=Phytoactinopolyspora halophila TaxID=1981511 RepID=A0A329QJP6_9ACTN|nr:hypothetical protein [Phytoactinopolyspora halophila]RAW12446.1 hypothetical protein DPM12_14885 [Phytoactinopolyspora halophila]
MYREIIWIPVAALLVTAAACSSSGDGQADERAASGDCPDTWGVTVNDPGDEPHEVIEFTPSAGDSVEFDIRMSIDEELVVDGADENIVSPPERYFGLVVTVDEVGDDEIAMSFRYDDASHAGGTHVAMDEAISNTAGLEGTVTTSRHGTVVDAEIAGRDQIEADAGHEVQVVLGELEWQLREMAVPFPEEPIGVGAEWSTTGPIEQAGTEYCDDTSYTLTSFDGQSYEVDVAWQNHIQESDEPGSENVDETTVSSATASGTVTFPLPRSSDIEITTESVRRVEEDGTTERREYTGRREWEVKPRGEIDPMP